MFCKFYSIRCVLLFVNERNTNSITNSRVNIRNIFENENILIFFLFFCIDISKMNDRINDYFVTFIELTKKFEKSFSKFWLFKITCESIWLFSIYIIEKIALFILNWFFLKSNFKILIRVFITHAQNSCLYFLIQF